MRQITVYPKIGELLPPDIRYSQALLRLLILREDLILEYKGISEEKIASLDYADDLARRIYFFRRSCTTLKEARIILVYDRDLKAMRTAPNGKHEIAMARACEKAIVALEDAKKPVNYVRNKASSHLDKKAFKVVLSSQAGFQGPLTLKSPDVRSSYRAVSHIAATAWLRSLRSIKTQKVLDDKLRDVLDAVAKCSIEVIRQLTALMAAIAHPYLNEKIYMQR